jgi:hypothetical protein
VRGDRLAAQFRVRLGAKLAAVGLRRERNDVIGYWSRREVRSLLFAFGEQKLGDAVRLFPAAGVRFEGVEDVFHQVSGFPQDGQRDTCTVIAPDRSFYRTADGSARHVLVTEQSVDRAVAEAEAAFNAEAVPFFDRFRSVSDAEAVLNADPEKTSPYQSLDYFRCAKGLICAKLAGRSDLKRLAEVYTRRLRATNDGFYLPRFTRLVSRLELE